MINNAVKILSTLANLTACRLLRENFSIPGNKPQWRDWEKSLNERLRSFFTHNEYSKRIDAIDLEGLHIFETRLFGRLVAAGMLIYLETNYSTVREALRTFSARQLPGLESEDSAVRYLRQAFFLRNLPNSVPQTRSERRKLLYSLSEFEKKLLNRWWLRYTHHILFENSLYNEDHIRFLKQKLGW